jgi:hypothetical protein
MEKQGDLGHELGKFVLNGPRVDPAAANMAEKLVNDMVQGLPDGSEASKLAAQLKADVRAWFSHAASHNNRTNGST